MWHYILAVLSGAAGLALLQRFGPALVGELWRAYQDHRNAQRVVALQLDPLLKAADELYGKLLSLAKEDFTEFRRATSAENGLVGLCSALYLFAQFWARVEILRRESLHAELARDKRGARILKFINTIESKQVRLVDRAWQRAIGESLVETRTSDVQSFRAFVEAYESSHRLRAWFAPLATILRSSADRAARQRLLQYGVIVHALIDTLDPKHATTKTRPGYANKLSRRTRRELVWRVFRLYLPEVQDPAKYTGTRDQW